MTRHVTALRALAVSAALATALTACAGKSTPVATDNETPASATPSTPAAEPTVGTYPAFSQTNYDYTLRVSCFCADANVPLRIQVRDGKAVLATYAKGGMGHRKGQQAPDYRLVSIQDVIDAANDTTAYSVQVKWPAGQDFPNSVYVDKNQQMADEEIGYAVSAVTPAA